MTLTSQHFINIMVGTRREHAILLTNFFLFLGNSNPNLAAEVLVLVGCSVPEGTTVSAFIYTCNMCDFGNLTLTDLS